jgi:Mor family transcriptional regulator
MNRFQTTQRNLQIVADFHAGQTPLKLAEKFTLSVHTVYRILHTSGIHPRKDATVNIIRAEILKKENDIIERFRKGASMAEIGADYQVSRERIRQILKKHNLSAKDAPRQRVLAQKKRDKHQQWLKKKNARCRSSFGCSYTDYLAVKSEIMAVESSKVATSGYNPIYGFVRDKNNALKRNITWKLTLVQWWSLWKNSGQWLAKSRSGYGMTRNDRTRGYEDGNVEIRMLGDSIRHYHHHKKIA